MTRKGDAKTQAKYDRLKASQGRGEDRRQSLNAMHRGMSGHPANPDKRVSFADMSDRQLQAHGMVRVRGFFSTRIISMGQHHDELQDAIQTRHDRKDAAKAKAKKAVKKSLQKKQKSQKRGFFYWE